MKKLCELVKIVENNEECVVLEVTGSRLDLIKLGCFNGDEKLIRLTKGDSHTCTVWTDNGHFSWHWGIGGHTIVSNETSKKGNLIQDCITKDFEIYIGSNKANIAKTLHIKSLEDVKHMTHTVKLMYWRNRPSDVICHLDGEYFTRFNGMENAFKHFTDHEYKVEATREYVAQTGCIVKEYTITK